MLKDHLTGFLGDIPGMVLASVATPGMLVTQAQFAIQTLS